MTSTTRRAALTALAGVPALAIPAVAVAEPVDPIFAAIERHKAAWKVVMDAMDVRDTTRSRMRRRTRFTRKS